MRDEKTMWLIAVLLVAAGALAIWYFGAEREPTADGLPVQTPPAAEPRDVTPEGPLHPLRTEAAGNVPKRELRPLPALDESDRYFKLELLDLFGEGAEQALVSSGLIERLVATIDNLPRQHVSERIRPLTGLEDPFVAGGQDDSGEYTLDEPNFRRYDALVEQFVTAKPQQLAALYRRYYPLFQKAYVGLGYPDGYFNDRLVEVIDHLLATPNPDEPLPLLRPNVLYEFADPDLESLSGGQKLMLRLGSANRMRVTEQLRELRKLIVDT